MRAVRFGNADFINQAFANKQTVDILCQDIWGRTGLMFALRYETIVPLLYSNKSVLDLADMHNMTALMIASTWGNDGAVSLLSQLGASLNIRQKDGRTALMFASSLGFGGVVRVLLSHGADVNVKDNRGWTALYWAVRAGNFDIVADLIDKGALIDQNVYAAAVHNK